jgi:hypothetical protein
MFAVKGVYDGTTVTLDQPVPITGKHEVIMTFLDTGNADKNVPETASKAQFDLRFKLPREVPVEEKLAAFNRLIGLTAKNPVSIKAAREERISRQ